MFASATVNLIDELPRAGEEVEVLAGVSGARIKYCFYVLGQKKGWVLSDTKRLLAFDVHRWTSSISIRKPRRHRPEPSHPEVKCLVYRCWKLSEALSTLPQWCQIAAALVGEEFRHRYALARFHGRSRRTGIHLAWHQLPRRRVGVRPPSLAGVQA